MKRHQKDFEVLAVLICFDPVLVCTCELVDPGDQNEMPGRTDLLVECPVSIFFREEVFFVLFPLFAIGYFSQLATTCGSSSADEVLFQLTVAIKWTWSSVILVGFHLV